MAAWWVFHGDNFEHEQRGGFLWAPAFDARGGRPDHWQRLQEARVGDVVFSCRGKIVTHAVAVVANARPASWPYAHPKPPAVHGEGTRVDGVFFELTSPRVATTRFQGDDVLHLFTAEEGPLDYRGKGKLGYFYRLPPLAEAYLYERGVRHLRERLDALRAR